VSLFNTVQLLCKNGNFSGCSALLFHCPLALMDERARLIVPLFGFGSFDFIPVKTYPVHLFLVMHFCWCVIKVF